MERKGKMVQRERTKEKDEIEAYKGRERCCSREEGRRLIVGGGRDRVKDRGGKRVEGSIFRKWSVCGEEESKRGRVRGSRFDESEEKGDYG